MQHGYLVGYARIKITPEVPVPLMGYGNTIRRISSNVLDDLYATSVAITDSEKNTILLIGTDSCTPNFVASIRETISEATGIPVENILINATHNHSAPDLDQPEHPGVIAYKPVYKQAHIQVALDALEDRKPADMYYGSVETQGLNFVRHYQLSDGSYGGDNFGDFENQYAVRYATEVDPTMHLIKFVRTDAKDVLIMNWRAHASITGGSRKPDLSADFVGAVRDYLENKLDCSFLYCQGCAGNVNPRSRIPEDDCTRDHVLFGKLLGDFAIQGLRNMEKMEPGIIRSKQVIFPGKINHTTDHLVEKAKEIKEYWAETGDYSGAVRMGKPYGIRTALQAGGIVKRSTMGETFDLELHAVCLNDKLAFATAPNELFDTNGQYVEDKSPFEHTMVFGYTNGQHGYVPSAYAWIYTCYESDTTRFAPGTAEEIAAQQLVMLRELKTK